MSAGVELTSLLPADAAAIVAGTDDEIRRWLNVTNTDVDELATAIERADPAVTNLGIRVGEQLAGLITCQRDQPGMAPGCVNVAYGLVPDARGRGVATAALRALTGQLLQEGLRPVLKIASGNHRSLGVASRADYRPLGSVTTELGTEIWHVHEGPH